MNALREGHSHVILITSRTNAILKPGAWWPLAGMPGLINFYQLFPKLNF